MGKKIFSDFLKNTDRRNAVNWSFGKYQQDDFLSRAGFLHLKIIGDVRGDFVFDRF